MKKLALALLLTSPMLLSAASKVNPADYTITVHVLSSHATGVQAQRLQTIVDGKQVELTGYSGGVLMLGDYKAMSVQLTHHPKPNGYDSYVAYQFLFPTGETRNFDVTGYGPVDSTVP